ncbi:unnamed protein product [Vitrella brassicaformis CCMP3155]|uniref:Uncharacterized protein n=2 Tax=Vitrella brassicaformis TaxID=1169539 RepID=A0A0G4EYG9_VITBC|nr:unnamed protein product [Vitrella brassicaformis CCMP3155]|eukprot:CEM03495.1 unnamed protein product [Vitrella brassicaformis CCMP3155]
MVNKLRSRTLVPSSGSNAAGAPKRTSKIVCPSSGAERPRTRRQRQLAGCGDEGQAGGPPMPAIGMLTDEWLGVFSFVGLHTLMQDFRPVCRRFKQLTGESVMSLHVTSSNIKGVPLGDFVNLQHLHVTHMNRPGFRILLRSLGRCRRLKKLTVEYCQLGNDVAEGLQTSLPLLSDLVELRIDSCKLLAATVHLLSFAFPDCQKLTCLSLADNELKGIHVNALCVMLPHCPLLEMIDLDCNRLNDLGALQLAEVLPQIGRLHSLSLRENHIGDEGGIALCEALAKCQHIRDVDLSDNGLTELSAPALRALVRSSPSLQFLDLDDNKISEEDIAQQDQDQDQHPDAHDDHHNGRDDDNGHGGGADGPSPPPPPPPAPAPSHPSQTSLPVGPHVSSSSSSAPTSETAARPPPVVKCKPRVEQEDEQPRNKRKADDSDMYDDSRNERVDNNGAVTGFRTADGVKNPRKRRAVERRGGGDNGEGGGVADLAPMDMDELAPNQRVRHFMQRTDEELAAEEDDDEEYQPDTSSQQAVDGDDLDDDDMDLSADGMNSGGGYDNLYDSNEWGLNANELEEEEDEDGSDEDEDEDEDEEEDDNQEQAVPWKSGRLGVGMGQSHAAALIAKVTGGYANRPGEEEEDEDDEDDEEFEEADQGDGDDDDDDEDDGDEGEVEDAGGEEAAADQEGDGEGLHLPDPPGHHIQGNAVVQPGAEGQPAPDAWLADAQDVDDDDKTEE